MTTSTQKKVKEDKRLSDGPDWTFDLLQVYLEQIDRVAKHYRLDTYPHQIRGHHLRADDGCLFQRRDADQLYPLVIR